MVQRKTIEKDLEGKKKHKTQFGKDYLKWMNWKNEQEVSSREQEEDSRDTGIWLLLTLVMEHLSGIFDKQLR